MDKVSVCFPEDQADLTGIVVRAVVESIMEHPVCRRTVTVNLEHGLHLVPCSMIAKIAAQFDGDVRIHKGTQSVDAKTVFDLMTLAAEKDTLLTLEAEGKGSAGIVDKLAHLFESNFEPTGSNAP